MAKAVYVGVGSKARKMKKAYIGIGGKARKVKKMYIGDSSGKVVAQDVQSGTTAAYGTIVTLTMDTGAEAPAEEAPAVEENIDPANEEG